MLKATLRDHRIISFKMFIGGRSCNNRTTSFLQSKRCQEICHLHRWYWRPHATYCIYCSKNWCYKFWRWSINMCACLFLRQFHFTLQLGRYWQTFWKRSLLGLSGTNVRMGQLLRLKRTLKSPSLPRSPQYITIAQCFFRNLPSTIIEIREPTLT